jgi:small conductance mechanosensitive channel
MDFIDIAGTKLYEFSTTYGIQIVGAVLILVLGRWLAKLITKGTKKIFARTIKDEMLTKFLGNLVYALLLTVVIIAALSKLGINTTSLIAILGAAGLAVGLALQGSLANFGSGVLLLVFRPFKIGEFVEGAGAIGFVEDLSIFNTTLKTLDNKVVIIPNGKITSDNIINYSRKEIRRVDLTFGVGYAEDIPKVRQVIQDTVSKDIRILGNPQPFIKVGELGDSSVNFVVRVWVKTEDYWNVFFDTTENVKLAFDQNKINIPYPQRDLHLVSSVLPGLDLATDKAKTTSLPV